jgi:RimJ/RimL family protein N-acetyltransferase
MAERLPGGGAEPLVRRLTADDAGAYVDLRARMLTDAPLAFGASPGHDFMSSTETVREQIARGDDSAIYGAFAPELVAVIGVYRDDRPKTRHKMHVWGAYVTPTYRGRGLGRRLLEAAVAHAREIPGVTVLHISVTDAAPAARHLYERAGFEAWGSEPEALRHEGRTVTEHHMLLHL